MKKLLMIPGPTPVLRSIQDEMGRETIAFGDAKFVGDFRAVLSDLKDLFDCSGEVFVISGSGTLAMEAAAANSTSPGDDVLIISHGYFSDRFLEIFERKGRNVDVLKAEWGKVVDLKDIEAKLSEKKYSAVVVTHVDTSTGAMADVAAIGEILKKYPETIYIVDGVCATAGIDEKVNSMNIDILLTASQKAFGVAPGLAMLWVNEKALSRRKELGTISEYYCDFEKWIPIMNNPALYFATPPVNLIWALKEAVRIIKQEGIEERYARHKRNAFAIQKAIEALGFTILADENNRAYTLSNVLYPENVDDVGFRTALAEEGVQVAGGIGPYAGKMFRLGHMGNIDKHDIVSVLSAVERTAIRNNMPVEYGTAVKVFENNL